MRTILTETQEIAICNEYKNSTIGVSSLSEKYHVGKAKIKGILDSYGIQRKSGGGQQFLTKNVDQKKEKRKHFGGKQKLTTEIFVSRAKLVHGDKYDYSETEYVDAKTKVKIKCNNCGKYFEQIPASHLRGTGCPNCSKFSKKYTTESWVEEAKQIHGDKYDYSKSVYVNAHTKICITCKEHGDFYQFPSNHLRGHGCPRCSGWKTDTEEFVKKATSIHGDKYDYSETEYVKAHKKLRIVCKKHGEFYQLASDHLTGYGCPICGNNLSKGENEIYNYISDLIGKENVIQRDRTILNGKELDIYIPSFNIAIEYNGVFWHSEIYREPKYHLNKLEECNKKGIQLISIFEDEYVDNKELVLQKIKHILKLDTNLPKVYGRQCSIKEITNTESKQFLEENHIQGFVASTVYLGCFNGEELVGVMEFLKEKGNNWNLTRFASSNKYNCSGIAGKLFKHFIRNYQFDEIKSFADRRWTTNKENNLYTKLGFKFNKVLPPDYRYHIPKQPGVTRLHKFMFRKGILQKKYNLPSNLTEHEMCLQIGAYRVYDCGLIKYVYKNE